MSEQLSDRTGVPGLIDRLKLLLPEKFRPGGVVVPVVRLSGVIGAVTPLRPGMSLAGVAKTLERAFANPAMQELALFAAPGFLFAAHAERIFLHIDLEIALAEACHGHGDPVALFV